MECKLHNNNGKNVYHCLNISKHAMSLLKTSCSCTSVIAVMAAGSLSIQGVTGWTDQNSGECSLGHTIPI